MEGRQMIQLAMPIEPGNSGSPLIDRQGRAVGLIAMKSVGIIAFAVPINYLKPLLEKPHPVPPEERGHPHRHQRDRHWNSG